MVLECFRVQSRCPQAAPIDDTTSSKPEAPARRTRKGGAEPRASPPLARRSRHVLRGARLGPLASGRPGPPAWAFLRTSSVHTLRGARSHTSAAEGVSRGADPDRRTLGASAEVSSTAGGSYSARRLGSEPRARPPVRARRASVAGDSVATGLNRSNAACVGRECALLVPSSCSPSLSAWRFSWSPVEAAAAGIRPAWLARQDRLRRPSVGLAAFQFPSGVGEDRAEWPSLELVRPRGQANPPKSSTRGPSSPAGRVRAEP
jgi:hypothetical protein